MSKVNKIKEIIKGKFGTNPFDPWSTKANLDESEKDLLRKYFKSRGINPDYVTKDQKIAHAKTGQFAKWKQDHVSMGESISQTHTPTQQHLHALKKSARVNKEIRVADGHKQLHSEEADEKDTINMDIPLLIRVLEFAREDIKSDIQLHKMVERLIDIRNQGTLSMDDYEKIVKEEIEKLGEAIDLEKYKEKAKAAAEKAEGEGDYKTALKRRTGVMRATGKQISQTTKAIAHSLRKEDAYQDSNAATQMPFDTGNNPAEEPNNTALSKKASKVVKVITTRKSVNEDMYDKEKDDKPSQSLKKPKMVAQKVDGVGEEQPDASLVMTGGKTMTGEPRDTIEVDPMLKKPKGGDVNAPAMDGKSDTKKENK